MKNLSVVILERHKENLQAEVNNILNEIQSLQSRIDGLIADKKLAETRIYELSQGLDKLNGVKNETTSKIKKIK